MNYGAVPERGSSAACLFSFDIGWDVVCCGAAGAGTIKQTLCFFTNTDKRSSTLATDHKSKIDNNNLWSFAEFFQRLFSQNEFLWQAGGVFSH